MNIEQFKTAFRASATYEVVSDRAHGNGHTFEGRVHNAVQWRAFLEVVLDRVIDLGLSVDISQRHFKKRRGGDHIFAWRIIVNATTKFDIAGTLNALVEAAKKTPRAFAQVDEAPLVGAGPNRNSQAGQLTSRGTFARGVTPVGGKSGGGGPFIRR